MRNVTCVSLLDARIANRVLNKKLKMKKDEQLDFNVNFLNLNLINLRNLLSKNIILFYQL